MSIYTVTNLNDSGLGSFREGLEQANLNSETTIIFSTVGIIVLLSELPNITKKIIIDGTTAPGYNGIPLIVIDNNYKANGIILTVGSDYSQIIALSIINSSNYGISLFNTNYVTLDKNYIGLDGNGLKAGNDNGGIYIRYSSNNNIGLNPTNSSTYVSNVISGNGINGIQLYYYSKNNIIVSNHIGTNVEGTSAIGNGSSGIEIEGSCTNNVIGGIVYTNSDNITNNPTGSEQKVTPVFIIPPLGNLISGNITYGIHITKPTVPLYLEPNFVNTIINGNFIGTNYDGTSAIENLTYGIYIDKSNGNKIIGCTVIDNPFVYYNVISGNGSHGIYILDSNETVVQGNFIGISSNNLIAIPNNGDGMLVGGNSSDTYVGGIIPLGNVISGNIKNGINITDYANNLTSFNSFVGIFAFGNSMPNCENGIYIDSSSGGHEIRTCVISGNKKNGIMLAKNAFDVNIISSLIGTDTFGIKPIPNGNNGILLTDNASYNKIGGNIASIIPRTTISSNKHYGIKINKKSNNNLVFVSFIGLDVSGLSLNNDLGNGKGGIKICDKAFSNSIGYNDKITQNKTLLFNYISNNDGHGIYLTKKVYWNSIFNNIVGYDIDGVKHKNKKKQIYNKSNRKNKIYNNTVA